MITTIMTYSFSSIKRPVYRHDHRESQGLGVDSLDEPLEVIVETQDPVEIVSANQRHGRRIRETQYLIAVSFEHSNRVGKDCK